MWFMHLTVPDVRMKICPKTMRIEERHNGLWRYYRAVPLPLKPDHAALVAEKYGLDDEAIKKLTGGL
jgi:hypothetical protein